MKDENKEEAKRRSDKLKKVEKEVSATARIVRDKSEYRMVECRNEPDFRGNRMETVRMDTGEIVDSRPLTPEERQETLPTLREVKPAKEQAK